jgi:hypothetical protein
MLVLVGFVIELLLRVVSPVVGSPGIGLLLALQPLPECTAVLDPVLSSGLVDLSEVRLPRKQDCGPDSRGSHGCGDECLWVDPTDTRELATMQL